MLLRDNRMDSLAQSVLVTLPLLHPITITLTYGLRRCLAATIKSYRWID